MSEEDPYRDPREGERIHAERRREEQEERARFRATLRPRMSRKGIALALLVAACVGGLSYWLRQRMVAGATAPAVTIAPRLPPLECKQLEADYHARLDLGRACAQDSDCVAEPRGLLMTGLDGCARYVAPGKDVLAADDLARKWQAGGCADSYRTCPVPRGAICEARAAETRGPMCVEKPPPEVPRTWHRLQVPGLFSFFAPPEVANLGLGDIVPEDSSMTRFRGPGFDLVFDVQHFHLSSPDASGDIPPISDTDRTILQTEQLLVGGSRARMDITVPLLSDAGGPRSFRVWVPHVGCQANPASAFYCENGASVGIFSTCNTKAECDLLVKVLHTFEAWSP